MNTRLVELGHERSNFKTRAHKNCLYTARRSSRQEMINYAYVRFGVYGHAAYAHLHPLDFYLRIPLGQRISSIEPNVGPFWRSVSSEVGKKLGAGPQSPF